MRYALMLMGMVLAVGIGSQKVFEMMLVDQTEPVRPTTPFTKKVSKLWASKSDDRSNIRSNGYWVNDKTGFGFRDQSRRCRNNRRPTTPSNPFTNR